LLLAEARAFRPAIGGDYIATRSDALLVCDEGGIGVLFVELLSDQLLEQVELAVERRLPLGRATVFRSSNAAHKRRATCGWAAPAIRTSSNTSRTYPYQPRVRVTSLSCPSAS
jgi:hypothetical protein